MPNSLAYIQYYERLYSAGDRKWHPEAERRPLFGIHFYTKYTYSRLTFRRAYAESATSSSISISTSPNSESRSNSPTHEQQQIEAFIIPRLKFVHETLQALLAITAHPFRVPEWELTKSLLIYQIQCLEELVTDYGDEYAAALARVHSVFLQRGIELQEDKSPSWSRSARAYYTAMHDAAENLVQCALDTRGENAAESAWIW